MVQENKVVHIVAQRRFAPLLASRIALLLIALSIPQFHAAAADDETPVAKPRVEDIVTGNQPKKTPGVQTTIIQSIEINERPLEAVLDYLSRISGKNIRVKKDKDRKFPITLKLENVTWQAVLDFIARKYGMIVDESMLQENFIFIDSPEKVSLVFNGADIRDVIRTIAIQANANIVIGNEVTGPVSMRLENVPWLDALNIVVKTLDFVVVTDPNGVIRITSHDKVAAQLEIKIFRLNFISPEGSKYTAVITTEYAARTESKDSQLAGSSLIDVLSKIKTKEGSISFDKTSNSLIVRDTSNSLNEMLQIINKLDVAPKQIHVSVKVADISDSDEERIGVKWGAGLQFSLNPVSSWASSFPFDVSSGLSRSLLGHLAVAEAPRRSLDPVSHQIGSASDVFDLQQSVATGGSALAGLTTTPVTLGSMGFANTTALMELLRTKTTAKIIQAPQIITLDNEEATIQVGQLVRYAENVVAQAATGGQVGGFREAAGSPLKLGFQLLVIAHVTGIDNNILMTAVPKTETFTGFRTFGNLDLPQTSQAIVVTKMMLRNGETGVIGGLREETENLAQIKVPVFGDIPFVGRLFKHRSKATTARNLMVFVTPTLIDIETDQVRKDLDKMRQDFGKPYTPMSEEEESAATAPK